MVPRTTRSMPRRKVLLAGDWQYPMYEPAFATALENCGVEVSRFTFPPADGVIARVEHKYSLPGPRARRIAQDLLARCDVEQPNAVLVWRGAGLQAATIRGIRERCGAVVAAYVHDDPFAHRYHDLLPRHHRRHWSPFTDALPEYDLVLFAKEASAEDARKLGARHAGVLQQYFVPWLHKPHALSASERERFGCDAAFAGHWEPDGREEALIALADAGLSVKVYQGAMWNRSRRLRTCAANGTRLAVHAAVLGEEYTKALRGASMALCFLSKMNRDVYTTRCFEIPACGTLLVSERTPELARMYREDEEAVFFSSTEELVEKATWLKENPDAVRRIAGAGQRRVLEDGHCVDGRARTFLDMLARATPG